MQNTTVMMFLKPRVFSSEFFYFKAKLLQQQIHLKFFDNLPAQIISFLNIKAFFKSKIGHFESESDKNL